MDEVLKIKKELEKTVPKNDTKRALELLKSLQSIPITLDVLQKTHIGFAVNKIRKSINNPEVSSMSKSIVKKWKKLLPENNPVSGGGGGNNNNNTSAGDRKDNNNSNSTNQPTSYQNNTSESSSPATHQQTDGSDQQQQPPQAQPTSPASQATSEKATKPKPAPTQTEVPVTTSEVRLKCRQLLTDALKKPLTQELMQGVFLLEEEILAGRIEECIYQEMKGTDMKYKNRLRSRVANLGDLKNPYLRLNVLRGDISPEKIAKMTAEEMASDELKRQREQFTKEAINDHQMTLTSGTKTSEIKCVACKKFNVTYNQVQTRSADEPMTTFCYCNECGKRWKFC